MGEKEVPRLRGGGKGASPLRRALMGPEVGTSEDRPGERTAPPSR